MRIKYTVSLPGGRARWRGEVSLTSAMRWSILSANAFMASPIPQESWLTLQLRTTVLSHNVFTVYGVCFLVKLKGKDFTPFTASKTTIVPKKTDVQDRILKTYY